MPLNSTSGWVSKPRQFASEPDYTYWVASSKDVPNLNYIHGGNTAYNNVESFSLITGYPALGATSEAIFIYALNLRGAFLNGYQFTFSDFSSWLSGAMPPLSVSDGGNISLDRRRFVAVPAAGYTGAPLTLVRGSYDPPVSYGYDPNNPALGHFYKILFPSSYYRIGKPAIIGNFIAVNKSIMSIDYFGNVNWCKITNFGNDTNSCLAYIGGINFTFSTPLVASAHPASSNVLPENTVYIHNAATGAHFSAFGILDVISGEGAYNTGIFVGNGTLTGAVELLIASVTIFGRVPLFTFVTLDSTGNVVSSSQDRINIVSSTFVVKKVDGIGGTYYFYGAFLVDNGIVVMQFAPGTIYWSNKITFNATQYTDITLDYQTYVGGSNIRIMATSTDGQRTPFTATLPADGSQLGTYSYRDNYTVTYAAYPLTKTTTATTAAAVSSPTTLSSETITTTRIYPEVSRVYWNRYTDAL